MAIASRRSRRAGFQARLQGRLKGWLVLGGEFLMGPRYVRLLEGIAEHGSVRAAAATAGLSYRTCLNRLRRMERVFGAPLVASARGGPAGGSTTLSPEGRELIRIYRRWRRALESCQRAAWAEATAEVAPGRRSRRR